MMSRKINMMVFTLIIGLLSHAQYYNKTVEGVINVNQSTDLITFTATAINKTETSVNVSYEFSVIKTEVLTKNISKNSQKGDKVISAGETVKLSETTINITTKQRTIILLLIYDQNSNLIGKDRIVLQEFLSAQKKSANSLEKDMISSNDDIILSGMIIDRTKTKPGRDFYSLFNSTYLNLNINGKKMVTIDEQLTIANNTKIIVKIENDIVFECLMRPKYEYLKEMSTQAVKTVFQYFQNLNNQNTIIQY